MLLTLHGRVRLRLHDSSQVADVRSWLVHSALPTESDDCLQVAARWTVPSTMTLLVKLRACPSDAAGRALRRELEKLRGQNCHSYRCFLPPGSIGSVTDPDGIVIEFADRPRVLEA